MPLLSYRFHVEQRTRPTGGADRFKCDAWGYQSALLLAARKMRLLDGDMIVARASHEGRLRPKHRFLVHVEGGMLFFEHLSGAHLPWTLSNNFQFWLQENLET